MSGGDKRYMLNEEFDRSNLNRRTGFDIAFLIAVIFCTLLSIMFAAFSFNPGVDGMTELDGRINPNIAEQAALQALPGIGPSKAAAIVSYRQHFIGESNKAAFKTAEDLKKVNGIGEKTAKNIKPFLKFE